MTCLCIRRTGAGKDIRDQIAGSPEKLDFVNYRIVKKDGSVQRVEEFGHRVFVPGVGAVFYVFFLDNDTKYKIYDIDSLTGLPGKTRFMQHAAMTMAMASLDPKSPPLAFLYVNIHNFNFYNLRNGSERGNQFLIKMAEVLRKHFPNSLVSRFTDDHFVVLSSLRSVEALIPSITGRIHELYDASHLDVKFGIYRVEDLHVPVESACGMAQMACDSIRELPDQHICFYSSDMNEKKILRGYIIDHSRFWKKAGRLRNWISTCWRRCAAFTGIRWIMAKRWFLRLSTCPARISSWVPFMRM